MIWGVSAERRGHRTGCRPISLGIMVISLALWQRTCSPKMPRMGASSSETASPYKELMPSACCEYTTLVTKPGHFCWASYTCNNANVYQNKPTQIILKKKSRNQGAWACGLILKLYDNPTPPTHFFLFPYPFISKCFFVLVFSLFMEFTGFLLWRFSHFSFHCCHAWNTTHKKLWGKKFVNIFRIISQVMYAWLSTTGCRMPFNIVLMEKKTNLYYWQWA